MALRAGERLVPKGASFTSAMTLCASVMEQLGPVSWAFGKTECGVYPSHGTQQRSGRVWPAIWGERDARVTAACRKLGEVFSSLAMLFEPLPLPSKPALPFPCEAPT